ncbi:hypothetical protein GCM10023152_13340 [Agromyces bauzanensis]|uniref:Insertion element IS402-like domain-containing protein n=1 Tax=Agromyces bauzanensis TaxID=1308924 RepID=A0A917PF57_9MICO|nr:hypothetical protein GCM10011372_09610 [Agromyces bauzanensis]
MISSGVAPDTMILKADEQWARLEPLLPSNAGRRGHPFREDRRVVDGIIYRSRTRIAWRDLPRELFGPWQTVWKRHRRMPGRRWDLGSCAGAADRRSRRRR